MSEQTSPSIVKLRRFLEPKPQPSTNERCEFCGAELPGAHAHVVNLETRNLLCACRPCGLLFTPAAAAQGKCRAVPQRYLSIREPVFTEAQWDALQIPVGMAFFFSNTALGREAVFYPSPAGASESLLSLETWDEIARANPLLNSLVPDVQALLVSPMKQRERAECYLVPIDACYELVGHIKRRWKGFDGGEEA